jgi:predicted esterase
VKHSQQEVIAVRSKAASAPPEGTVIFAHGLGDTGHGWASAFAQDVADSVPHVRFLFPSARQLPVTLNAGMTMHAWYDIMGLGSRLKENAEGIEESAAFLQALVCIESTQYREGSERVVLAGFSQGGAVAIYAGHQYSHRLAGIIALSSYVARPEDFPKMTTNANKGTPVLMCHGEDDQMIPLGLAKESHEFLMSIKGGSDNVELKIYPHMAHESCMEELLGVSNFIANRLPPPRSSRL